MNSLKIFLPAAAALALTAGSVMAQPAPGAAPGAPPAPPPPMVIKQVKPGLYMVTGNGGNSAVRVTRDGVILVDTKNPGKAVYDELMAKIKTVTPGQVKYVFITHHHNDHSGNTIEFLSTAEVIGHTEEANIIQRYTPAGGARKPETPNIVYTKPLTIKLGEATATAYHFEPAHTGGDTIVYFPDIKALAMGDELVAATPNSDYPFGGSVLGWQKSLDAVLKLDFDVAIPGHGDNPMTRAEVVAYKAKWDKFVDRARAEIKAGTPKDQLIAKIKTDDLGWTLAGPNWTSPARLDPFYAELSK